MSLFFFFLSWRVGGTWDVFGPTDDDHKLAIGQVAQRGQGLDVAVGHAGVGHGVDFLGLHQQQMRHDLGHCGQRGRGEEKKWPPGFQMAPSGFRDLPRKRSSREA